jgi:hypothetical protein
VALRIFDRDRLWLIGLRLKASVEERDGDGKRRMGRNRHKAPGRGTRRFSHHKISPRRGEDRERCCGKVEPRPAEAARNAAGFLADTL